MAAGNSRRRPLLIAAVIGLLIAAALALPPFININRYQRQIAASLQAGLGHPVEISGIKLVLLPRPGVEIANLVVDSNPGFSAEPILQCSSVTAGFRLTSLWRGRLEISRISLDEPSLNLERAPSGEWNFASVLLQAARTPQAPTGRALQLTQKRFPYIEATHARINLKHGPEKLPLSFLNAEIAVWLENPNEWRVRFAAQPTRTDVNLSLADTGVVRVSGSVRRASSTGQLPLDLRAEWHGAPLGQVSRMLLGQDLGWRGESAVDARLLGTPDELAVEATASAADFRRDSVMPARALDLHTTCKARYHQDRGLLDDIRCVSPVGDGRLDLTGTVRTMHESPAPALRLAVEHLPASAALEWLRHIENLAARNVSVTGTLDGWLNYDPSQAATPRQVPSPHLRRRAAQVMVHRGPGYSTAASGSLAATHLALHGDGFNQLLPDLHADVVPGSPAALAVRPARFDLGGASPMLIEAHATRQDFSLHASGVARVTALEAAANAFRLAPALVGSLAGRGTADANVTITGRWLAGNDGSEPEPPAISGTLGLHDAAFDPSYLPEPVQIGTAVATFSARDVRWSGIVAGFGKTQFTGSLRIPLPCPAQCVRSFDFSSPAVSVGSLAASLRGDDGGVVAELLNAAQRLRASDHPPLPPVEGTLHVAALMLGPVKVESAATTMSLHDGRIEISSFEGQTLEGTFHATGTVTVTRTPMYRLTWQLSQIDAAELSQLLGEDWGPGTLDLSGRLNMTGSNAADLSSTATGSVDWQWRDGGLPQTAAETATSSPLAHFDRWSGSGVVTKGRLSITASDLVAGDTTTKVSGTIGLDRSLHLQIAAPRTDTANAKTDAASGILTGTLAAPVVQP